MELGIHVEERKVEESDVPLSCRLTEGRAFCTLVSERFPRGPGPVFSECATDSCGDNSMRCLAVLV